jgi:amidase
LDKDKAGTDMTTIDLCLLDLVEVGSRIQSGRLSSAEVTQAVLARITKLDPHLHSYATLTADLALAQAKQADAEIARGKAQPKGRSPGG